MRASVQKTRIETRRTQCAIKTPARYHGCFSKSFRCEYRSSRNTSGEDPKRSLRGRSNTWILINQRDRLIWLAFGQGDPISDSSTKQSTPESQKISIPSYFRLASSKYWRDHLHAPTDQHNIRLDSRSHSLCPDHGRAGKRIEHTNCTRFVTHTCGAKG